MNEYRKNRLISISRDLMPKLRSGRSFHVSFILNKNQLLAFASNDYSHRHLAHKFGAYKAFRTESAENYIVSRHSEVCVLKTFLNKFGNLDMSGLTLFNTRIGYNLEVMSAKPCQNCQNLLDGLNFKSIIWT